jgi:hypothetical protein
MGIKEERAARLRLAREAAGFAGPTEAAAHFRWPFPTYAGHENAHGGITRPGVAARYARAFHVTESWLLTGQGQGPRGEGIIEDLVARYDLLGVDEKQAFLARILERAPQSSEDLQIVGPKPRLVRPKASREADNS